MGTKKKLHAGAVVLAVGRSALGVVAVTRPWVLAGPWVGDAAASGVAGQVFARALGGRDFALGVGATGAALFGNSRSLAAWSAAGAVADSVDLFSTIIHWSELPGRGRILVAALAGGAALSGFGFTGALLAARGERGATG
jgi:hypothetical protein